jgi:hypothetical protein
MRNRGASCNVDELAAVQDVIFIDFVGLRGIDPITIGGGTVETLSRMAVY